MTISFVSNHGVSNSKVSGTILSISPASTVPVGAVLLARGAFDNVTTTSGVSTDSSVADSKGNTWTRLYEQTRSSGVAADGVTVYLWLANITVSLLTSDTVTLTVPTLLARTMAVDELSCSIGTTVGLDGGNGVSGSSTAPSVTVSSLVNTEHYYTGVVGVEGPGGDGYTNDANYLAVTASNTSGGLDLSNVSSRCGHDLSVNTTEAFAPTLTISRNWAAIVVGISERAVAQVGFLVRATNATSFLSGTSSVVQKPIGTTSGDLLVATISFSNNDPGTITLSSGWTTVPSTTLKKQSGASSGTMAYLVAGGSEPDNYTFSWTLASSGAYGIVAVQGANTTPFDVDTDNSGTTSVSHVATGVDPVTTDALLLTAFCSDNPGAGNTQTYSTPGGMSPACLGTGINQAAVGVFYEALASGSPTGTRTATAAFTAAFVAFTATIVRGEILIPKAIRRYLQAVKASLG